MFCSCSSDCINGDFFNSTSNRKRHSNTNMELLPLPITIEQEWLNAVTSNDNKKIKHLFKEHHPRIKFLRLKFEDGDNSLHKAIQKGNRRLARFLLILKMNVCIYVVYIIYIVYLAI